MRFPSIETPVDADTSMHDAVSSPLVTTQAETQEESGKYEYFILQKL
jgi:hypothetical protein